MILPLYQGGRGLAGNGSDIVAPRVDVSPLIANCVAAISIQSRWRLLRATAAPVGPATQVPAMQGREAQVRPFVEAYREQRGRDPRFTEVCNPLRLPPSTASDYLR